MDSFVFKIHIDQSLAMLLRVTENSWLTPSCRGVLSAGTAGQALARAGLVSKGHPALIVYFRVLHSFHQMPCLKQPSSSIVLDP